MKTAAIAATALLAAASGAQAQFSPGFQIDVRFAGQITPEIRQAFDDAAARWGEVIVGDIRDVTFTSTRSFNCGGRRTFRAGDQLDDIIIYATIENIDGPGRVLGSAGPCVSDREGFTRLGQMRFDSADVANLVSAGTFGGVILHEMGHVLGIGTKWGPFNRGFRYTGAGGIRGNEEIGGVGRPFIEDEFGPGTRGGHWDEAEYQGELMTGFLSGGLEFSALTVESLTDLGYEVNSAAAEAFTKPDPSTAARGVGLDMSNDIMIEDMTYTIDEFGNVLEEINNNPGATTADDPNSVSVGLAAGVGLSVGAAVLAVGMMVSSLRKRAAVPRAASAVATPTEI